MTLFLDETRRMDVRGKRVGRRKDAGFAFVRGVACSPTARKFLVLRGSRKKLGKFSCEAPEKEQKLNANG
jgi:hypothetical protein